MCLLAEPNYRQQKLEKGDQAVEGTPAAPCAHVAGGEQDFRGKSVAPGHSRSHMQHLGLSARA